MKIYAIRDRMLDYFQVPVVVHREQDLIAAIARGINGTGDDANELAQAPDHYELWEIGEVDDQGNLRPTRIFKANCASFIRNGVWKRGKPGAPGAEGEPSEIQGRAGGPGGQARPRPGAPEGPPRPTPLAHQEPAQDAGGGNPASDR